MLMIDKREFGYAYPGTPVPKLYAYQCNTRVQIVPGYNCTRTCTCMQELATEDYDYKSTTVMPVLPLPLQLWH